MRASQPVSFYLKPLVKTKGDIWYAASLRWIDVVSRDLVGMTIWQGIAKDWDIWQAVVCQPKPATV